MIYPNSNLPTVSQSWGRAIQKGIETLEATVKTNEINNKARDTQLQANYVQTNKNIQDIKFALTSSGIAVTGVNEIKNAIYVPGTTQINGNSIQTGTFSASKITSGTIDAATVEVKNLNASKITTGTLTGITIQTGTSGQRAVISSTQIDFYGPTSGGGAIYGNSDGGIQMQNSSGSYLLRANPSSAALAGGGSAVAISSGRVDLSAPLTYVSDALQAGATSTTSLTASGIVSALDTYQRNVQSGRIMYVASNGTYNCATSSARYKQDINPYVVDVNKFFQLEPVSFRYKMAVEQFGDQADIAHGFIAEQAAEVGMDEFVDFQDDGNGGQRPDNFRYIDFTAAMYSVIKKQQETIGSLTARIEALESKV